MLSEIHTLDFSNGKKMGEKEKKVRNIVSDEFFLGKGDHWGEMAILTNWRVDYKATASTFCIL